MITLGVMAVSVTLTGGVTLLAPGPMSTPHGSVENCSSCHASVQEGSVAWVHKVFAPSDPVKDSSGCLNCHKIGSTATNPHGADREKLDALTKKIQSREEISSNITDRLRQAVFPVSETFSQGVFCQTCHKEHKGEQFDLKAMADSQCQACHSSKIHNFGKDHPEFDSYPFKRRTRIAFNHDNHFNKHFPEVQTKKTLASAIPAGCSGCHQAGPEKKHMEVQSFKQTCSACHLGQIVGTERPQGPKGITLLTIPGLDVATLKEKNVNIGEWPEDSEAVITPFMELLIGTDDRRRQILNAVRDVDLLDLSDQSDATINAVRALAWEIKDLYNTYSLSTPSVVAQRLKTTTGLAVDTELVTKLVASMPRDVLTSAQRQWLPNLAAEIEARRKRGGDAANIATPVVATPAEDKVEDEAPAQAEDAAEEEDVADDEDAAEGEDVVADEEVAEEEDAIPDEEVAEDDDAGADEEVAEDEAADAGEAVAEEEADAGEDVAEEEESADSEEAEDAAAGEATSERDELLEDEVVAEGDTDIDDEAEEDVAEGDSEDGAEEEEVIADEEVAEEEDAIPDEEVAEDDDADADEEVAEEDAGADEEVAEEETGVDEEVAEEGNADGGEQAAEKDDAADGVPAVEKAVEQVEKAIEPAAETQPIVAVDAETWTEFGGWYRQDFAILYKPTGHEDGFMKAWLDFSGRLVTDDEKNQAASVFNLLTNKNAQGQCAKCHSVDSPGNGTRRVNWKPSQPPLPVGLFTAFSHAPHLSIVGDKGCLTCHKLKPKSNSQETYKQFNPLVFDSNFSSVDKNTCANCHKPDAVRQDCLLCHAYHVNQVSTPIPKTKLPGE